MSAYDPYHSRESSHWKYLIAIIACLAIGVLGILGISIWVTDVKRVDLMITFISTAIPSTIFSLLAFMRSNEGYKQSKRTHDLVNGRLDEFKETMIALAEQIGHRAGVKEGREASEARTDALYAGQLYTGHDSIIRHEGTIQHEEAPIIPPEQAPGKDG